MLTGVLPDRRSVDKKSMGLPSVWSLISYYRALAKVRPLYSHETL